jgi:hypothetical protein
MTIVRQTSFAGGELAPSLYGRTDLDRYKIGARQLKNFLVSPFGAASNRPGTQYLGAVKTGSGCAQARLVPFIFSDEQALVIEFGYHYIRFWLNGVHVSVAEIASPYAVADIPRLKFAQKGNIITITHPGYTPRELERTATSPLTFTLTTISFDAPVGPTLSSPSILAIEMTSDFATSPSADARPWIWKLTAICQSLDGTRTWEAPVTSPTYCALRYPGTYTWSSGTTYALADQVMYDGYMYTSMQSANVGHTPGSSSGWWAISYFEPTPLPGSVWRVGDVDHYAFPVSLAVNQPTIMWAITAPTTYRVVNWCLYRSTSLQLMGLVAVLGPTESSFVDTGDTEPDFLQRPPKGENPFEIYNASGGLVRTEEPATVAYQDERLIFGGTAERPNYLFMSRVGDWHNFDQYPIVKDDDSITVGLAGRRFEEIRSLLPGRSLLAFSMMSEWCIDGGQPDQPVTPAAISARIRSERGSTWLDALKVGDDHALFVQRKGMIVRDLRFDGQAGTYVNADLSLFSHHLLAGKSVAAWCWQEDPWSIVWLVLSDGTLLSLTFMPEQKVIAWARHELAGGGLVESICSIPEGEEDAVYLIVNRGGVRNFERLASRQVTNIRVDALFLDSAGLYHLATDQVTFTGLNHLEGLDVHLLVDGAVMGPYTVAAGVCDPSADFPITGEAAYDAGTSYFEGDYCTYAGLTWRSLVDANLGHTPTDGAYWTYVTVWVGLRYDCDFETLDLPPGEGKTRVKAIKELSIELEASRGLWVGEDFDHLDEWQQRDVEDSYETIGAFTGQARFFIRSTWNHGGRAVVRQVDPLPCTILTVTREVEYGQ